MMMRTGRLRIGSESRRVKILKIKKILKNKVKIFSLELIWKEKCSVLAEENSNLNDLITVLQQVKFNVLCQKNLIKDVTTPSPGSHGALL